MRDWRAYVTEHLGSLADAPEIDAEVVGELAGHLEESEANLRTRGISLFDAERGTGALTGDWMELRRGIVAAKREGNMHERVKQIWIPGLVTLVAHSVFLAILQIGGVRPFVSHPGEPRQIVIYLPWLAVLPLIGAAGGYLSRRAQGSGWRVYFAASLLPVIALGTFFVILLPLTFVIDPQVPMSIKGQAILAGMLNWVLLPVPLLSVGVALQGMRRMQHA